ncbi:hypothetical protein BAE44_0012437 [Dichanthelium oligosanthes]|uniref:Embryo-specific protein ATS3A n=1 Tax=Dichanthelium oligosanthes TaxID=888268 RepID=A0A1E5VN94_9POAL|nr:hypothetical protein BAE44_0012437 [Dichanthelium oligosanthes]
MAAPGAAAPPRALPLLLAALLLALAPSTPSSVAAAGGRPARACTYTLRVKTSCASPARTSDAVGVAFGDAYRNEAHAPRLPTGPGGRALERCGTDTFRVAGPCGYGVCYLYLRRAGRDGWAPEWVQVVQPRPGAAPATATFYFGNPLPDGVWYGHDRCPKAKAAADDGHAHAARPATATDAPPRASNSSASARG